MLKIFRKVRQRLIRDGNLKRYIAYTIGEIMLVVIGIMIAVQIDGLNNLRQRNALEKKVLIEILGNLESDMLQIDGVIRSELVVMESDSILLSNLQSMLPFSDSLGTHMYISHKYPHFDT